MKKMQKVDKIFSSSFDEFVEKIFQKPPNAEVNTEGLPLNNLGDYIELFKEKKALESTINQLNTRVYSQQKSIVTLKERISRLVQREKSLIKEKKAAESSAKNKSEFLAHMSHEIRTPMNGVIGTISILKETGLTSSQYKFLEIIETCANSLLSVIDDILDYSKIEAGELKIESVDFNLKDITSQVRDILSYKAQEKGIDLTMHIVHGVPVWLKGDPLRIRQILLNLTNNAIKFTESGSVGIEISVESETEDLVNLVFKVKDTGIGIGQEQQKLLFQSYSQINADTTRKYGGSGLGLCISKQLVDLMDGTIRAESKEGEGSTFWFSLPLTKQKGTKKSRTDLFRIETHRQLPHGFRKKDLSILLVEDDAINQKITKILLEKEGFQVIVAENGIKAIEALEKQTFDLVLMDVEMPEMNGYEATRHIRSHESDRIDSQIPIIAMTAHAMSGDREKCLNSGMNDYIPKPINTNLLNDLIDQHMSDKESAHINDTEYASSHLTNVSSFIQADKLKGLQEEVEEKFGMIVDIFVSSLPQKLTKIQSSAEEENFEELRTFAHQLKGSCATFYAQKMVEICQDLEDMAVMANSSQDELIDKITDLVYEAQRVETFLKETTF